jgi:hypothetical protein
MLQIPTVLQPTFVSPTLRPTLALPGSTLIATPTQAPIPTRAPTNTPTVTPTLLLDEKGTPIFPTVTSTL